MNLHILNGDVSHAIFKRTDISGSSCSWPEILCEGPPSLDLFSAEFMHKRYDFLRTRFNSTKTEYNKKLSPVIDHISKLHKYSNIYLWFEYDLFCHVNLFALVHKIKSLLSENQHLYYICPVSDSTLIGLGELDSYDYIKLHREAEKLTSKQIEFLSSIWIAYNNDDPRHLLKFLEPNEDFPHLKEVLLSHFRRFPSRDTGIDQLRLRILKSIKENAFTSIKEVIGFQLKNQGYYGFGDLQYELLVNELNPFIQNGDSVSLNAIGISLANGLIDYQEFNKESEFLGGAENRRFRWWEDEKTFIPQFHEPLGFRNSN